MPAVERPPLPAASLQSRHQIEFDPGLPDLAAFPRRAWASSLRRALRTATFADLGPADPRGRPELRNELMAYLGRVRGAAPEPEHTLICGGLAHGYAALCRVLRARGIERIAVESPGSAAHRLAASAAGLDPVPIPVDRLGLDVAALGSAGCEVAVVTPTHQYPAGGVLAPERRAALLEWAEDEDALIVEDDYDSELRYDRMAVGALQGLAPERVCQIGSLSLRLAPALRMGWILSPSWLTGALTYELGLSGGGPPALDQLALGDFLTRGELDRHLRRMRGRYRLRREAMVAALGRHLPEAQVEGVPAGTFALVSLPGGTDQATIVSTAAARGVGVQSVDAPGLGSEALGLPGSALILGFANLSEQAIERGIALLAEAVGA
jgi:GntR family transcriptional regulator/MocR family aminotransferase